MSTAQSLIDDVRARIVEANADFFSDDVSILRWLNQGYRNFVLQSECLDKVKGFAIVANQYEYSTPADCLDIQQIRWKDQYFVRQRDLEEFARISGFNDSTSDRPRYYTMFPAQSKIRLYEIPNTTSVTTTVNGSHNSSTTTITVASAASFPSRGRILIGTEQILYYAKTATTFLQCVRGDGETTAASHTTADVVTDLPMTMMYAYSPVAMTTGGSAIDCQLPAEYDEAIIAYATAICFRVKDKYEIASQYNKTYKEILDVAIAATAEQQRDRKPCIKDDSEWENS